MLKVFICPSGAAASLESQAKWFNYTFIQSFGYNSSYGRRHAKCNLIKYKQKISLKIESMNKRKSQTIGNSFSR